LTSRLFIPAPDRTAEHAPIRQRVTEQLPAVQPLLNLAKDFIHRVRQRLSTALDHWLDQAAGLPALAALAKRIRQD
jgi:transposase